MSDTTADATADATADNPAEPDGDARSTADVWGQLQALAANLATLAAGWLACVLGAAHARPLAGVLTVGGLLISYLPSFAAPHRLALYLAICGGLGWLVESFLGALGWVTYPASPGWGGFAPLWAFFAWANVGALAPICTSCCPERRWLLAAVGAAASPLLAHWAWQWGAVDYTKLGALTLWLAPPFTLAMLGLFAFLAGHPWLNGHSDAPDGECEAALGGAANGASKGAANGAT